MELIFKNGNATLDKHIPYDKENLGKIRLIREGDAEGIWAMFSEDGKKKYNDDATNSGTDVVVLCNQSLAGVPWGAYVKVEYQGSDRPVAICEDQFDAGHIFQYADWASASICESISKELQEGKYKIDEPGLKEYLVFHIANAPESDITAALKTLMEQE